MNSKREVLTYGPSFVKVFLRWYFLKAEIFFFYEMQLDSCPCLLIAFYFSVASSDSDNALYCHCIFIKTLDW